MEISQEQKNKVHNWVNEGKSISDIQSLVRNDFKLSMTYMDVRFLVDDLGVAYQEEDDIPEDEIRDSTGNPLEDDIIDADTGLAEGKNMVKVIVDSVIRPGSLVSGSVTFSDGITLGWQLTSTGQLGLIPGDDTEYRPSNTDLEEFQNQLQSVLKDKGF